MFTSNRQALLMSPAAYEKLERDNIENAPSVVPRSGLFAGSLRPVCGMEVLTHHAIPAETVYKIPHELVVGFRYDAIALEKYIQALIETGTITGE